MENRLPERRQRVRILTLKNFARFALLAIVALVGVNLWSEMRGNRAREYGRLYSHELKNDTVPLKPHVEVVQEAQPVPDRIGSDPLLLAPAAREAQYLSPEPPEPPAGVPAPVPAQPVQAAAATGNRIGITNDGGGLMVTGEHRLLRGGFGR